MKYYTIKEACDELGIASRTLQYHLLRIGVEKYAGRYLINEAIMVKLMKRQMKPGPKKIKKSSKNS